MGRLVMGVIAIAIVGYLGYRAMYRSMPPTAEGTSAPKQQLDNVRGAAKRIEAQQDKVTDKADKVAE